MATHTNEKNRICYVYFKRKYFLIFYTCLLKVTPGTSAKGKKWLLYVVWRKIRGGDIKLCKLELNLNVLYNFYFIRKSLLSLVYPKRRIESLNNYLNLPWVAFSAKRNPKTNKKYRIRKRPIELYLGKCCKCTMYTVNWYFNLKL